MIAELNQSDLTVAIHTLVMSRLDYSIAVCKSAFDDHLEATVNEKCGCMHDDRPDN